MNWVALRMLTGDRAKYFFFQAEDGIRDVAVTGVQTCALPISFSTSSLLANKFAPLRSPPQKSKAAEPVGRKTQPRRSSTLIPDQALAPPTRVQASSGHVS